ncbi:hypothetical protein [Chryseobacterium luquanense]|uniref:Uncharacterized protein n=1 Tax=Chryseobacterium luquanense TaxID=2983766 RepID=A0ABT3Y2A8_9FLAO|nr:hypothetical protein [Chryseobacterium luquanense]MCX8532263.1 hypothetical protein [Chryseobacterium luquanense]
MNKNIDIKEIIDFIKINLPKESQLNINLNIIEIGEWKNKAYYKFVDSTNANKQGSKWQFKDNIILEHPKYGTLILDILKDDQLGGIEFFKFI